MSRATRTTLVGERPRPRSSVSPPVSRATYFSLGCTATARLAGRVQGVVVQMTTRLARRRRRAPGAGVTERELHVDDGRLLLLVLDLRLGERRLAVHAPVHGLQPLVDEAPADEASELAHDGRLVRGRHRQVRVRPVAEDPEPPELLALDVDELERVVAAAAALLGRIHGAAHVAPGLVEPELLVDLMLDGQAVAVPAGHVDGIVAEHRPGLDDDVLEDLVERGAPCGCGRWRRAGRRGESSEGGLARGREARRRGRRRPSGGGTPAPAGASSPAWGSRSGAGGGSPCSP